MGRTIPSFRLLIEIEKSEWMHFRKQLGKEDLEYFNQLFTIPKLYCHSLSNLSKPTIVESIIMIDLFYNFMAVRKIKEEKYLTTLKNKDKRYHQNCSENIQLQNKLLPGNNKDGSFGYNDIINDWKKFIDCLNKDDKDIFLNMIRECYYGYHKSINASIKEKSDSCLNKTISLFMAILIHQQKQINWIKSKQRFLD